MTRLYRIPASLMLAALIACSGGGGGDTAGNGGAITFAKSYGGPAREQAASAKPRPGGGYVFAGTWNSRDSGTGRTSAAESEGSEGDFWVVALDAEGDIEWQRSYGARSTVTPGSRFQPQYDAIAPALPGANGQDGGIWLTGRVTTRISPGAGYEENATDLVVTRLDANGNVLWSRDYDSGPHPQYDYFFPGEETSEYGLDIWPTQDGGALVAAEAKATVSIDGRAVEVRGVYVLKVDADGASQWSTLLRHDERFEFARYALTVREVSGGAIVGSASKVSFDSIWGTTLRRPHVRITRLDAGNQAVRWTRVIEETELVGLRVVDDDVDGQFDGVLLWGTDDLPHSGLLGTHFLRKIDANGEDLWRHESDEYVRDVASNCVAPPNGAPACQYALAGVGWRGFPTYGILRTVDIATGDTIAERRFETPGVDRDAYLVRYLASVDRYQVYGLEEPGNGFIRFIQPAPPLAVDSVVTFGSPGTMMHGHGDGFLALHENQVFRVAANGTVSLLADLEELAGTHIDRAYAVHVVAGRDGRTTDGFVVAGDMHDRSAADRAAWVLRLDGAGNIVWQRRLSGFAFQPQGDGEQSLSRDPGDFPLRSYDLLQATGDGGFVLGGRDATGAVAPVSRLIKLDGDGDIVWSSEPLARRGDRLDVVRVLSGGEILAAGKTSRTFEFSAATWLARVGPSGAVQSRHIYSGIIGTDLHEMPDGGALMVGHGFVGPAAVRLNASGGIVWAYVYPFGQSRELGSVRVAAAADGGYVLAASVTDIHDPPASGRYNVLLIKIGADGAAQWAQLYGGLYDEIVHAIEPLPDGGFIVSAQSDSMGEYSEAWLLRVGPDGRISEGCNADLGRFQLAARPITLERHALPAPAASSAVIVPVDTTIEAQTPSEVVTARQCRGIATNNPGDIAQPRTLTVTHRGDSPGVVTSLPHGIVCGTAGGGVCSAVYADGTLVSLRVDFGSVDDFTGWGPGCDLVRGNFGEICDVRMNADKTIEAFFGAPPPPPPGQFTLTVSVDRIGGFVGSTDGSFGCGVTAESGPRTCSVQYAAGTVVNLYAAPLPGHNVAFEGWQGDCAGLGGPNISVNMTRDHICRVVFASGPGS